MYYLSISQSFTCIEIKIEIENFNFLERHFKAKLKEPDFPRAPMKFVISITPIPYIDEKKTACMHIGHILKNVLSRRLEGHRTLPCYAICKFQVYMSPHQDVPRYQNCHDRRIRLFVHSR